MRDERPHGSDAEVSGEKPVIHYLEVTEKLRSPALLQEQQCLAGPIICGILSDLERRPQLADRIGSSEKWEALLEKALHNQISFEEMEEVFKADSIRKENGISIDPPTGCLSIIALTAFFCGALALFLNI